MSAGKGLRETGREFPDLSPARCYIVGGAVRDELLGLPVKDRDYVVVGSTAVEMPLGATRLLDMYRVYSV